MTAELGSILAGNRNIPTPFKVIPNIGKLKSRARTGPITQIIVHHGATKTAASTFSVLAQRELSTHMEVDQAGNVYQYVDLDRVAYHAGDFNPNSIGIDLTGGGPNLPFTEVQLDRLAELIKVLSDFFKFPRVVRAWGYDKTITPKTPGVYAHAQVSSIKIDPSQNNEPTTWNHIASKIA